MLSLRGHLRGLLRLKRERVHPRRGSKPRIGAYIAFGQLRMTVQAGFTEELWEWLVERGWRELIYRPDRRHYLEIPAACVTELVDAQAEERPAVLAAAVERALPRPIVGDPTSVPRYIVRH